MSDHDHGLEASVLRYVLAAPPSWKRLGDLRGSDMAIPSHREILDTIRTIGESGTMPGSDRVIDTLRKAGRHEAARVALALLKGDATPLHAVAGAVTHLRSLSRIRRLKDPLMSALALADSGDIEECHRTIAALADGIATNADDDGWPWLRTDEDCIVAALDALRTNRETPIIEQEGWKDLGEHMAPGNLIVLAGETGAGKSSLALWLAERWWKRRGSRVGIVSLEDREAVWGTRRLAQRGDIDITKPERLTTWQAEELPEHIREITAQDAIRYAIMEDHDVEHVTRYARGLVERGGCGLIVVDYLQEIGDAAASRKGLPQHERLSGIARQIKRVAKVCRVPVVLVSQLSRPDGKKHREPTIYDIKGSGDVENMAEAIILLWKESDDEGADAFAKVAKLKDSPARPRSRIGRNSAGAITTLVKAERQAEAPDPYAARLGR